MPPPFTRSPARRPALWCAPRSRCSRRGVWPLRVWLLRVPADPPGPPASRERCGLTMRMTAGGCRACAARSVSVKSMYAGGIRVHHTARQLLQQPSENVEPNDSIDSYVVRPRAMSEMWKPSSPPTARMNAA